jgi:xylulose-5-phosphate/fructose-6-phosphate phosphoketolase
MKLQQPSEHPHGLPDRDFEQLFAADKPIVFAYHGYPGLIHCLTYRRCNQSKLPERGYKEEGTPSTPFDLVEMDDADRFHLAIDVIDRVPRLKDSAVYLRQYLKGKLIGYKGYIRIHEEGMPKICECKWPAQLTESHHK